MDSTQSPVFDTLRYTIREPTANDVSSDMRLRSFTNLPLLTIPPPPPPMEDDNVHVQRWASLQEENEEKDVLAKQRERNDKEEQIYRAVQESNDATGGENKEEEAKPHTSSKLVNSSPSVSSEPRTGESVGVSSAGDAAPPASQATTASALAPFSFSAGVPKTEAPAPFSAETASKFTVKFGFDPDNGGGEVKQGLKPEDGGNKGGPAQKPPVAFHFGSTTGSSSATSIDTNNTAAPSAPVFRFGMTSDTTQAPALTPDDAGTANPASILGLTAALGPHDGASQRTFVFGASANTAAALAPSPVFPSNEATSFAPPSF